MNETRNETTPIRHATQPPPPLVWDRLTARNRFAYAQALNTRLTALRDDVRDTAADLATATRMLHTTRARADLAYRHLLKIKKETARLEKKAARLNKQIAARQNQLAGPLVEATAERLRK